MSTVKVLPQHVWHEMFFRGARAGLTGARVYKLRVHRPAGEIDNYYPKQYHCYEFVAVPPEHQLRLLRDTDVQIMELQHILHSAADVREFAGHVCTYHPTGKRIIQP
jgi:hypothetical protein